MRRTGRLRQPETSLRSRSARSRNAPSRNGRDRRLCAPGPPDTAGSRRPADARCSCTAFLVAIATLTTGPYKISPGRIARILAGDRTGAEAYLLLEQRLPRVVAAAAVGACLAASGAIFQTTSRNPLGSPDLIGFTTGAATGGILIILLAGAGSQSALVAGTCFGGFAAATAVMLIGRAGAGTGQRLIVGGIAVAAMLSSTNDYLISRAEIEAAER